MKTEFIEFKKKKYPYKFGMGALLRWSKRTGKDLGSLAQIETDLTSLVDLMLAAFEQGHRMEFPSTPFSLTEDDVIDMIDQDPSLIERMAEELASAFEDGDEKKKQASPVTQ